MIIRSVQCEYRTFRYSILDHDLTRSRTLHGDVAGNARTLTTGTSPIEIMASKGIFVRTKAGVKIPDQIRLTHGLIKSLYVSQSLTRFRDCLLNYRYPEIKETARNQENEIPIHDEFSHAMRALEYYAVNIKIVCQRRRTPRFTVRSSYGIGRVRATRERKGDRLP